MAVKPKDDSGSSAVIIEDHDINFYSDIDRNHRGEIANEMPAWTDKANIARLREEIRELEQRLANNEIGYSYEPTARAELKAKGKRLYDIEQSIPKFNEIVRDDLWKMSKELGQLITESMFTRSACMKGTPDPAIEADRSLHFCIKLPNKLANLATKNGIPLGNKMSADDKYSMATRVGATKLWRMMREALGESSNSAILQKE